jgi:hypothetical protein
MDKLRYLVQQWNEDDNHHTVVTAPTLIGQPVVCSYTRARPTNSYIAWLFPSRAV